MSGYSNEPRNLKTDEQKTRYRNDSKQRLKNILSKKFKTTIIFPLSQFEMTFGKLWGHGKNDSELSAQELANKKIWLECRERILNNGHKQERNSMAEIDMYDISWNRYQTQLIPNN